MARQNLERVRVQIYLPPALKEFLDAYALENGQQTATAITFILSQFRNQQAAMANVPQMLAGIKQLSDLISSGQTGASRIAELPEEPV